MHDVDKKWTGIVDDMSFEHLMCQLLGHKTAYHSCDVASNITDFKKWMKRAIVVLEKRAENIDADQRLKELLHMKFTDMKKRLHDIKSRENFGDLYVDAMRIISYILGFDGLDKEILRTPIYSQTLFQHINVVKGEHDPLATFQREKSLRVHRAKLIQQLKDENMSDPEIAFIFNISDYEVKKQRKFFHPSHT